MPETENGSLHREGASEHDKSANQRRDDPDKLLVVMNAALVGVPSAYAMSNSLAVTAIAAALGIFLVSVYLIRRSR
ncbi:hypothetical protein [Micromonospora sp. HK10]|uniref:hypothetical protein n=1 Tax=Micromonospora sp. HK10 TaxID=1538294 RepID=UPI000626ED07|nr:hypothetical protein [Micromonospora sp. HK10]KKK07254.1 hypothetical protein LQ51_03365 [Micromonospora sp. HK10]